MTPTAPDADWIGQHSAIPGHGGGGDLAERRAAGGRRLAALDGSPVAVVAELAALDRSMPGSR